MQNQRLSLGRRLIRRVAVLSLIAIFGLISAVIGGALATLSAARANVVQAAATSVNRVEVFLNTIQSDLAATSGTFANIQPGSESLVLREVLSRNPAIFEVLVVNLDGEVQAARRRFGTADTHTLSEQPWLSTIKDGNAYISSVDTQEFGLPFVTIATAIKNQSGQVVEALVSKVDLTTMWDIVSSLQIGQSGDTYIVDAQGHLLAYRDLTLVKAQRTLQDLTGLTPQELLNRANSGQLTPGLAQQTVVSTGEQLPNAPWYAIVELPVSEPLQTYLVPVIGLLLALVIGLVTVYSLVRFVSQQVVQPLVTVTRSIESNASGDLKQHIEISGHQHDEIGLLVSTLNNMTERINTYTQELIKANEEVKESLRVKDEFLAVMSHELRTPLNAIIGFTGIMLTDEDFDPKHKRMTERVEANSHRLLSLINDVLDISKIQSGHLEITPSNISLKSTIMRFQSQLSVLAERKGLKFSVSVQPGLDQMYMDEDALWRIVNNLVSNAIKFTDQGDVSLKFTCNEDILTIQVSDTGIGIPAHKQSIIFESFRQVDSSYSRKYGGTGLGLAIVRHLCAAMGGTISVDSTVGQGSTFTVTLPLQAAITQPAQEMEKI